MFVRPEAIDEKTVSFRHGNGVHRNFRDGGLKHRAYIGVKARQGPSTKMGKRTWIPTSNQETICN